MASESVSPTLLVIEACVVVTLRASLFFASRKYLLSRLYHDLDEISIEAGASEQTNPIRDQDDSVDIELLPTSVTSAVPSRRTTSSSSVTRRAFHSVLSRTIFQLSLSESCALFAILMCQGLDILHPWTRLWSWNISLYFLLSSILIIIPLSYSLVLSYRSSSASHTLKRPSLLRIFFTTLPVALFLFILSFIPIPEAMRSSTIGMSVISRLAVVGTFILGILSGFGAVNNAWNFFPRLSKSFRTEPSDEEVKAAEDGLQRVREDLMERRRALERLEASQTKPEGSWLGNIVRGNSLSEATQEIAGLEALEYQMARNLTALKQSRDEHKFSRTIGGRLWNWGGRIFAIYCVYRIIISVFNLVAPVRSFRSPPDPTQSETRTTSIDFLTMILAYILSLFSSVHLSPEDISVVSRQISLLFVGIIILTSIRMVLRSVARALRVTGRNLGTSLMLLIISQLMGIYLLATLIQLRNSFPPPPIRPDITPDNGTVNLFSTLPEFQVFGSLFDGAFLLAAGVSLVVFWFDERINGLGDGVSHS
ncbi:Abscisic acid G-protein coupled receptor-domain-containing protein [Abortiporus biennis]|nr:Abscisic acid G-protein coupled receptor-domain-containing protein [Abortiporus biennis]